MLEAGILNNDIPMPKEWTRLIKVRKYISLVPRSSTCGRMRGDLIEPRKYIAFLYQEIGAVRRKTVSHSEC